jgi:predicted Fe-Mo cluster-binding NifX family protein
MLTKIRMKVVLPIDGDRISPVLDAARTFLLVTASSDGALTRKAVLIADADPVTKAKRIAKLGGGVLICGAISWPMEAMLISAGIRVVPNTCGPLDEVLAAYFAGIPTRTPMTRPLKTVSRRSQPRMRSFEIHKDVTSMTVARDLQRKRFRMALAVSGDVDAVLAAVAAPGGSMTFVGGTTRLGPLSSRSSTCL